MQQVQIYYKHIETKLTEISQLWSSAQNKFTGEIDQITKYVKETFEKQMSNDLTMNSNVNEDVVIQEL